ncbi:MAG: hypothetical protein Q8O46_04125 [bacterium]|nr:hypothetical protein [bacterium]
MLQKIVNFIKYNNATAIIFTMIFSGVSVSLAASPQVRDSVYSSSEVVSSIDNRLIISANLDNFDFNLRINSVTDDAENYYVAYDYKTLSIEDSIWKNVNLNKTLKVQKEAIEDRDLGLFVAQELAENINSELYYLQRVQELEREKGKSKKVITVEYGGLVGKLLDPEEKVIEGYDPVIPEPEIEEPEPEKEPVKEIPPEILPMPTNQKLDEQEVRRIIDQYLAEHKIQPNPPKQDSVVEDPKPEKPMPDPTPILEPTPTPEPEPTPNPTPIPDETPEETPESTPEPQPEAGQPSAETPVPELTPTPEPAPGVSQ